MWIRRSIIGVMILMYLMVVTGCQKREKLPENMNDYQQTQYVPAAKQELDPIAKLRAEIKENNKLFGAAFLGNGYAHFPLMNTTTQGKCYEQMYPFLKEISISNCVDCSGDELYCIVPTQVEDRVTIYHYEMGCSEQLRRGEVLYEGKGECVLLAANCSDLYPNTCVVIDCANGEQVEFIPSVSLMDGCLCPGNNTEKIYDFSQYEMLQ